MLDPSHEGIGESFDDEQDPGRACRQDVRHRIESPERIGILEAPGVRVHGSEEEPFIRQKVQSHEHQRLSRVKGDQVDRRLPEDETRVNDTETGLDALDILGNQLFQVAEILNFEPLKGRSHPGLRRVCGKQTVDQRVPCLTTRRNNGEFHR